MAGVFLLLGYVGNVHARGVELHAKRHGDGRAGHHEADAFGNQAFRVLVRFLGHRDGHRLAVDEVGQVLVVGQQHAQRVGAGRECQHGLHLAFAKVDVLVIERQCVLEIQGERAVDQQMVMPAFGTGRLGNGRQPPSTRQAKLDQKRRLDLVAVAQVGEISLRRQTGQSCLPGVQFPGRRGCHCWCRYLRLGQGGPEPCTQAQQRKNCTAT